MAFTEALVTRLFIFMEKNRYIGRATSMWKKKTAIAKR